MMKSYMVIDRKECNQGDTVWVCEVESVEMHDEMRVTNPWDIDCFMVDIPEHMFTSREICPIEQEIYAVYHEGGAVFDIFNLSKEERDNW